MEVFLRVLDEYSACKDEEQAETKEETAAHFLRVTTVEEPMNAEENGIADCLV